MAVEVHLFTRPRSHLVCAACDEGTDAETTMLEIIDGQLALREIEQWE